MSDTRINLIRDAIAYYRIGINYDIFREPVKEHAKLAIEALEHILCNGVTLATDNNFGSKWIPVREPPKESGEYIVMIHRAANPTALLYHAEEKSWFEVTIEDGEEVCTYYPVDYWMPFPQPPKEGK